MKQGQRRQGLRAGSGAAGACAGILAQPIGHQES